MGGWRNTHHAAAEEENTRREPGGHATLFMASRVWDGCYYVASCMTFVDFVMMIISLCVLR